MVLFFLAYYRVSLSNVIGYFENYCGFQKISKNTAGIMMHFKEILDTIKSCSFKKITLFGKTKTFSFIKKIKSLFFAQMHDLFLLLFKLIRLVLVSFFI